MGLFFARGENPCRKFQLYFLSTILLATFLVSSAQTALATEATITFAYDPGLAYPYANSLGGELRIGADPGILTTYQSNPPFFFELPDALLESGANPFIPLGGTLSIPVTIPFSDPLANESYLEATINATVIPGTLSLGGGVSGPPAPNGWNLPELGLIVPGLDVTGTIYLDGTVPEVVGTWEVTTPSSPAPVPEPASFLLVGMGLTGLWSASWFRRRRS